jgi:hypothetical protein
MFSLKGSLYLFDGIRKDEGKSMGIIPLLIV